MSKFSISYVALCTELFEVGGDNKRLRHLLLQKFSYLKENQLDVVMKQIQKRFISQFNRRWISANKKKTTFEEKYCNWLKGTFTVNFEEQSPQANVGRPKKNFADCCERSKRYKIAELRSSFSQEQIDSASSLSNDHENHKISADRALALYVQTRMTKYQYQVLRQALQNEGYDILPSYKSILSSKKECYPENIEVTESSARVPLQNLLDHTAERILKSKSQDELLMTSQSLTLYTKWGCDGASGQSEFHQKFLDDNLTDSNLFMTSVVPLKITPQIDDTVVWENTRPSSTRFCRSLQFQFTKETPDVIRAEKRRVDQEIENLNKSTILLYNKTFEISHKLIFSMLDGKTAQSVTETPASSSCFICGVTTSHMNELQSIHNRLINEEATKFGMSPLHARIKFMESILHIAYNLPFKRWRITSEFRPVKDATKKRIQQEFKQQLGLNIDQVKQGTGSSNNGNVARRFFSNPQLASQITGVSEELIKRFSVILEIITCNEIIDERKFGEFAYRTAELFVENYEWYNMPSTVHKVLVHGEQIIANAAFPVGVLSEEAQEHLNKDYKRYRIMNSRKCSRTATNEDIFHMMLLSSDPLITNLRPQPKKKYIELSEEAKDLLRA